MAQDFTMKAGDTRKLDFTILDEETGVPLDITTATLSWGFSKRVRQDPFVTKTLGSGIQILNGPQGQCRVTILPADTQGRKGRHYHELEVTEVSGEVTTVASGEMEIEETYDPSI